MVRINGDIFETDLYSKPSDCHQFLEFNSAHSILIKKSIAYTPGLRIKRLCSSSSAFEKHLESIRSWFGKRSYPKEFVDNQPRRVVQNILEQLPVHQTKHGTGVPLVVTYHPRFHDLGSIIRKNFIYLYAEEQVKQVFTPARFLSFWPGFSLRNHLVRPKVYPLLREKGSSCCENSRCETCFNIKKRNTFQSFVTKKVLKSTTIFIRIVSVLFTFFLVKCVTYSMLDQLLIDFVCDEITKNVPQGLHWKVVLTSRTTSIKIS